MPIAFRRWSLYKGLKDAPKIQRNVARASAPMNDAQFERLKSLMPMAPRGAIPEPMSAEEFMKLYPPHG